MTLLLNRSIYQKFREVDLLDKKNTVTALKPGEDRAILLGLGMILCSVMMYFVLGITILRSYADRYRLGDRIVSFTPYRGVDFDILVRNMFYSSDVLVDKLLCSFNLKITALYETRFSETNYTPSRVVFIP